MPDAGEPVGAPRTFPQTRIAPAPGSVELLVVRHGQSEASVEGEDFPLVDGHGDPPLSVEGHEQAALLGARLALEPIDAIYVTTLTRTAQTAAPAAAALGLVPVVEADLREVHLGDWEAGLFRQKVADRDPVALRMFEAQRWDVIPGAEPGDAFAARVRAGFDRIVAAHTDQRVLVVVHGGVIAELFAQVTGSGPWTFIGADNASISHLVVSPGRWLVRAFNDTAHLGVPLLTAG